MSRSWVGRRVHRLLSFRKTSQCLSTAPLHTEPLPQIQTSMSAWRIRSYDGIAGLHLDQGIPVPTIKSPSDVLIRVHASSINPLDIMMTKGYGDNFLNALRTVTTCGTSGLPSEFPLTLGRDFSGVVVETGKAVDDDVIAPGDEVWGAAFPTMQGAHGEFVVVPNFCVSKKPHRCDHVTAASIPYAGLTAWSSLVVSGGLFNRNLAGTKVLVIGASGGVGTIATQLLKAWECDVTAVCSGDSAQMVSDCGAEIVLDYKQPSFKKILKEFSGFDVILDCSGKNDESYLEYLRPWKGSVFVSLMSPLLRSTSSDGLILGGVSTVLELVKLNVKSLSDKGIQHRWGYFTPNPKALETMADYVDNKQLKPVIQEVFSYSDMPAAYEAIESGSARGKIVVNYGLSE